MKPSIYCLAFLAALASAPVSVAAISVYKVDRTISARPGGYSGDETEFSQVRAEIGVRAARSGDSPPHRDAFEDIYVIGTTGVAKAWLDSLGNRCEFLCGNEIEECHYTALIGWSESAGIGTPLVVATGLEVAPTNYTALTESASDARTSPGDGVALAFPEHTRLSITPDADQLAIQVEYDDGDIEHSYEVTGIDCQRTEYQQSPLSRLTCQSVEILQLKNRPVIFSYADYNVPTVAAFNRFAIGEHTAYTVAVGLKAYTAYGLLIMDEGKPVFVFSSPDWALLC